MSCPICYNSLIYDFVSKTFLNDLSKNLETLKRNNFLERRRENTKNKLTLSNNNNRLVNPCPN